MLLLCVGVVRGFKLPCPLGPLGPSILPTIFLRRNVGAPVTVDG